jgi:hypothetical protein
VHNSDRVLAARVGLQHHQNAGTHAASNGSHTDSTHSPVSKTVTRTLRAPSRIVLNQHIPQQPEAQGRQHQQHKHERGSQKSKSTPSPRSPRSSGLSHKDDKGETAKDKPQDNHPSSFSQGRAEPNLSAQSQGFDYHKAARILNQAAHDAKEILPHPPAHGPTPHSPEPQKRMRVIYDRRTPGHRPRSIRLHADESSSHNPSTGEYSVRSQ